MNKILFSHSYFLRFDPKQWKIGLPYAPLGTLYAAALLRDNGYQVNLFDSMFAKSADEIIEPLENTGADFFVLYDDGFNYLTKMCLTNMREASFRMIHLAKERGMLVIVSSSDSTDHYAGYLGKGADFILLGEGEQTLLELLTAVRSGQSDHQAIAGLSWQMNGVPVRTAPRKVMSDLDSMPLPAWDLVN